MGKCSELGNRSVSLKFGAYRRVVCDWEVECMPPFAVSQ